MYLGIDLGGINIAVGLVDDSYHIINKDSVPTGRTRSFEAIVKDMADLCRKIVEEAGYQISDVKCIGIGAPGTPDIKNKCVLYANNLIAFQNVNLETELQKYFPGMPVYLENDANAAAYGEILAGAAKDVDSAVIITLGTGVGGGIVIENKIQAGFRHTGAEIGHMVIEKDGAQCTCGRRGCFEAYSSATALIRQTAEIIKEYPDSIIHEMIGNDPSKISGKTAFLAAKQGDEAGQKIVDQYVAYLGEGVTNIVNILWPEAIVIGGGISKEGENLLAPLREYVHAHQYGRGSECSKIVAAELGNDAGIIGAAMLFKQAQ
ncbi:MAG: ROK family protein [Clostridia bacterium]|nr:ROK family protein [Clostridia bacterium]